MSRAIMRVTTGTLCYSSSAIALTTEPFDPPGLSPPVEGLHASHEMPIPFGQQSVGRDVKRMGASDCVKML